MKVVESCRTRKNAEVALLDWLNKSKQLIPKKRKEFYVSFNLIVLLVGFFNPEV